MKPRCLKCRGALVPEKNLEGRVMTVGCVNCGNRFYRDFTVRKPDLKQGGKP
ncbi:MAG: hypothetical protein M0T70_06590 [Geobacteraceae bacterium]|nr:hypothetical protein [Geobacteraceae bacterium]